MKHMGPEMHAQPPMIESRDKRQIQASLPAALAEVALIDAKTCAATGGMSVSQWHNLVREGAAPKPLIRTPRFTRWGLADVRKFFVDLATQSAGEERGQEVVARAQRASLAAKAKRQQIASTTVAA